MKKQNKFSKFMQSNIFLFIVSFAVLVVGFSLTNTIACIIYGFSDGTILSRMSELPYWLYAIFSLIMSGGFCLYINSKTK